MAMTRPGLVRALQDIREAAARLLAEMGEPIERAPEIWAGTVEGPNGALAEAVRRQDREVAYVDPHA